MNDARESDREWGKGRGREGGDHHGEGKGERPWTPPPKKVGFAKSRLLGRLAGREAVGKDEDIMEDLAYRERKEGYAKARKGLTFTSRTQNQIINSLLIDTVLFLTSHQRLGI